MFMAMVGRGYADGHVSVPPAVHAPAAAAS